MLTLDRFLFIYKPLHYEKLVTARRVLVAIVITWLLCVLLSTLYFVLSSDFFYDSELLYCFWSNPFGQIVFIVLTLIPYLLGLLFNVWVVYIAVKNIHAVYKMQGRNEGKSEKRRSRVIREDFMKRMRNKKELHLMRVFGAIVISNTVTWIPYIVVSFLFI